MPAIALIAYPPKSSPDPVVSEPFGPRQQPPVFFGQGRQERPAGANGRERFFAEIEVINPPWPAVGQVEERSYRFAPVRRAAVLQAEIPEHQRTFAHDRRNA